MTTIELVSIIRKRGQPTLFILMIDNEIPVTIQYKVPKTVQTQKDSYVTLRNEHFTTVL